MRRHDAELSEMRGASDLDKSGGPVHTGNLNCLSLLVNDWTCPTWCNCAVVLREAEARW